MGTQGGAWWVDVPTPCYVIDEAQLERNLKVLRELEISTSCNVLLAQKASSG